MKTEEEIRTLLKQLEQFRDENNRVGLEYAAGVDNDAANMLKWVLGEEKKE